MFNRQGDDGAAAARGLIESMQVQCKIYEEWIEVMSDYSTVFSDDRRGVAENYYGSGAQGGEGGAGEDDGGDGAGNSTVSGLVFYMSLLAEVNFSFSQNAQLQSCR